MSEKVNNRVNIRRRRFLTDMIAGTAGATVLTTAGSTIAAEENSETPCEDSVSRGYHETEHIKTYYEKARF